MRTVSKYQLERHKQVGSVRRKMGAQSKAKASGPAIKGVEELSGLETPAPVPISQLTEIFKERQKRASGVEYKSVPPLALEDILQFAQKPKGFSQMHKICRNEKGLISSVETSDDNGPGWTHEFVRDADQKITKVFSDNKAAVRIEHTVSRDGNLISDISSKGIKA